MDKKTNFHASLLDCRIIENKITGFVNVFQSVLLDIAGLNHLQNVTLFKQLKFCAKSLIILISAARYLGANGKIFTPDW